MSRIFTFLDFLRSHKISTAIIFTALFVLFLDGNSVWERHYRWQRISELKETISELQASYDENTRQLNELRSNPENVAKIARERYYMTREGEDLYIIERGNELEEFDKPEVEDNGAEPEV